MKIEVTFRKEVEVKYLYVEAGVRYWEDATVNGVQDNEGDLIPLREGDLWKPMIDLKTGAVKDWPKGTEADIHYKVCDAGEYWLCDEGGNKVVKWCGDYVPSGLLGDGFGDYIILKIESSGNIVGWGNKSIDEEDWKPA